MLISYGCHTTRISKFWWITNSMRCFQHWKSTRICDLSHYVNIVWLSYNQNFLSLLINEHDALFPALEEESSAKPHQQFNTRRETTTNKTCFKFILLSICNESDVLMLSNGCRMEVKHDSFCLEESAWRLNLVFLFVAFLCERGEELSLALPTNNSYVCVCFGLCCSLKPERWTLKRVEVNCCRCSVFSQKLLMIEQETSIQDYSF